ncbi:ABC transporter substrate-binding protein, partial [Rhizobiaceae sp. 2RAB30]
MTISDQFNISRRSLLALAGVGLATTVFPRQLLAQSGGVLIIAAGQDIPNFDPHTATGYSSSFFMRNVYDPLVRISGNPPVPAPGIAESWTVSPDGTEYTFVLNKAAKFHSGNAVTADDVVYSFGRALK